MKKDKCQGMLVSNIVKEYPDMIKIVIYHDNYWLPASGARSDNRKRAKIAKREDSIHRSLRRTKTTIQDIMLSNRFELWCTFTYNCRSCRPRCNNNPCTCSREACKRFDINYTHRTLRNWFRNQRTHSPDLKYLAVPEFHKNGAVHFHCLLSNFNGRLRDSGKRTKHGQVIYNASGYYSGWTEFVRIGERFDSASDDYYRVISYLTKYVTKDMPLIQGRRRFLVSTGLQRPVSTVNGLSTFNLWSLVRGALPKYIDSRLELQEHVKVGPLVRGAQGVLFNLPAAPRLHVCEQDYYDH